MIKIGETKYYCDRCGKEVRKITSNSSFFTRVKHKELDVVTNDLYVSSQSVLGKDADNLYISDVTYNVRAKIKNIILCNDCKKDFEKFMRGAK